MHSFEADETHYIIQFYSLSHKMVCSEKKIRVCRGNTPEYTRIYVEYT